MKGLLRNSLIALAALLFLSAPVAVVGQEARVSQKKIERQKKKHDREARKEYRIALKQHYNNQSKETKAMMKTSRKQARKTMPVRK